MTYTINRTDLASITDLELAFSTSRLLPAWDDIPAEFKQGTGNIYTEIAEAIFIGKSLPVAELEFRQGFDDESVKRDLNKCVRAHLASFASRHEHKMAGIAYLISQVCEVRQLVEV